jgi:hypothetical protein
LLLIHINAYTKKQNINHEKMALIDACARFNRAQRRGDVAEAAAAIVVATQGAVQDGCSTIAAGPLFRALTKARLDGTNRALFPKKPYAACDTMSLIGADPWDPLHLLLFICQCHLRASLARLFSDAGSWSDTWRAGVEGPQNSAAFNNTLREEARACQEEWSKGIEPLGVRNTLARDVPQPYATAMTVCFEGMISEEELRGDDLSQGLRPSRRGVRLLERAALAHELSLLLQRTLCAHELATGKFDTHAEMLISWFEKCVRVDANNALLLRMDEWAVLCHITSNDVAFATGERGVVPYEHRAVPAAWVAREALPDDTYQQLMRDAKKNDAHPANAYVAFSGVLEQHYGLDWLSRCFVARLNPSRAVDKLVDYVSLANDTTAPLVVQGLGDAATVLYRTGPETFVRVKCNSPAEALSAWIVAVETREGGQYSRKLNVADILQRIRNAPDARILDVLEDIGGACIAVEQPLFPAQQRQTPR